LNININLLYLIVFNLERQLGGNINYNWNNLITFNNWGKMQIWHYYLYKLRYSWFGDNFFKLSFITEDIKNWYWQIFYLGLLFDEFYARFVEVIFRQTFILPAIFIFDRFLNLIMGPLFLKNILFWTSKYFYKEQNNIVDILNLLFISLIGIIIFLNILIII
jgi:hypothetical protein